VTTDCSQPPDAAAADYRFPRLAKSESDGVFCYHVQRRLSCHITRLCNSVGMHPNLATGIDLLFAVAAAVTLYLHYFFVSVLFIQLFGLFSCVDGELARLSGRTSQLGDYYDTMVDRVAELLIVGSLFLGLRESRSIELVDGLLFAYLGAVFLITNSSEKFRSTFKRNYPKRKVEGLFTWICAGSDVRLFYLSIGILVIAVTGSSTLLFWILLSLSVSLYLNFLFRLRKVRQQEAQP
jgi:phosphatidylglycerophosphate synthase